MPRPRPDTSIVKLCYACKANKPPTDFHRSSKTFDGLQSKCKECAKLVAKAQSKGPGRRAWRHIHLRNRYKLSLLEYEELVKNQDGACAICGKKTTELCVDHCKITKEIRGLLCQHCNRGIGIFYHDAISLRRALDYLERTGAKSTHPLD